MCFEVLNEFDEVIDLPPEFYVTVDGESNDELIASRADNVIDNLAMHEAPLVHLCRWKVFKEEIAVL